MTIDMGAIARDLAKAKADFAANAPRPPAASATSAELIAELERIEAALPAVAAWLAAHPGALTALDDLCDAMAAAGLDWAHALRGGVDGAPGAVAIAAAWLPRVIFMLREFQPAAVGLPGGFAGARGHV